MCIAAPLGHTNVFAPITAVQNGLKMTSASIKYVHAVPSTILFSDHGNVVLHFLDVAQPNIAYNYSCIVEKNHCRMLSSIELDQVHNFYKSHESSLLSMFS